jgi:predicted enzyme related to lactoylglutathione lyase
MFPPASSELIGVAGLGQTASMKRVTGIGGIFFKANDPEKLRQWYAKHLDLPIEEWGGASFKWREAGEGKGEGYTVWSPFESGTDYFAPSDKPFMINFRVEDLDTLLDQLRAEGVTVDEKRDDSELGKFGWIMDPEGNRIELWEPPREK